MNATHWTLPFQSRKKNEVLLIKKKTIMFLKVVGNKNKFEKPLKKMFQKVS